MAVKHAVNWRQKLGALIMMGGGDCSANVSVMQPFEVARICV